MRGQSRAAHLSLSEVLYCEGLDDFASDEREDRWPLVLEPSEPLDEDLDLEEEAVLEEDAELEEEDE